MPSDMNAAAPDWDDAEKATLTRMWSEGGSSARQISVVLQRRSRAAVLGMARRLNLTARPQQKRAPITQAAKPRRPHHRHGLAMLGPAPPSLPPTRASRSGAWMAIADTVPVPLVDLNPGMCKWPIGDDRPYLFCGAKASDEPYCEHHAALSRGPGTESERAAHRAREKATA